jgi:hypothetical protein
MYKLQPNNPFTNEPSQIVKRLSDNAIIPFDPANTDYANFKREINEGTAELQDADGNTMTAEQAQAFVKELP